MAVTEDLGQGSRARTFDGDARIGQRWDQESPETRIERRFPPRTDSVAAARALIDLLPLSAEVANTARLLTSELATNAVVHAGGEWRVVIVLDGMLHVEVLDDSPTLPGLAPNGRPMTTTGRGLWITEHLASRWGSERCGTGKSVWFDLDLPLRVPASCRPAGSQSPGATTG